MQASGSLRFILFLVQIIKRARQNFLLERYREKRPQAAQILQDVLNARVVSQGSDPERCAGPDRIRNDLAVRSGPVQSESVSSSIFL